MNTTNFNSFNDTIFLTFFTIEGIIAIPTVFGNLLLIYCIKHYKTFHTRSYILIANLAVSDFLIGAVFIPYDMSTVGFPQMRQNKITCILRNALLLTFVGASVVNLLLISLERYAAIAYPLWHLKLSPNWLIGSIILAWSFSSILAILPLMGWNSWNTTLKCTRKWNDTYAHSYKVMWILICVLTIIISISLFIRVVIITFKLLDSSNMAEGDIRKFSPRYLTTSIEKTKVLILILGVFVVCWAPYCIVVFLEILFPSKRKQLDEVRIYCGMVAFVNSSLNWVIYGLKNKKIRHAFIRTLKCGSGESMQSISRQNSSNPNSCTEFGQISSISL